MSAEVIVIGGGPAGATAAMTLGRHGVKVRLVDPLGVGGQLINVEYLPDWPGSPAGVAGWDLAAALGEAVLDAGAKLTMGRVTALHAPNGPQSTWQVDIDGVGQPATAVILATGTVPTPLVGGAELEGRGVSYCASCDGGLFRGQDVVVVGGGDIAMAEACSLAPLVTRVVVAVAGPSPDAAAAWLAAAQAHANVEILTHAAQLRVERQADRVIGVSYLDAQGALRRVAAAGVFGGLAGRPAAELGAGLAPLGEDGGLVAGPSLRLGQRPGLFVAGDVRSASARLAVTAAGDGAAAAAAIVAYLR